MATEQVSGEIDEMGPACDIYSLGVILYELLTGRLPFEGPPAVVLGLIKVSSRRAFSFRPDLAPSLEAICLKAMAKRPGDRFASMAEFAASLKVFLDRGDYTQAGVVPAGLLKPPLRDNDAPSSEERQLVERLLAGPSPGSDHVPPEPDAILRPKLRGLWPRVRRLFLISFSSLAGAAAILLIVLSRFSDADRRYVFEYGLGRVPPLPQARHRSPPVHPGTASPGLGQTPDGNRRV